MISDVLKRNVVNVEGDTTSPHTVIFSHGFGSNQSAWNLIKPAFKQGYKLVTFDHAGAGNTDLNHFSPAKYQSLEAYASDLIEICDTLHLKDAIFVGHSAGAMIGLLASLSAPELFSKLVLIGASPRYLNDGDYIGGFTQEALNGLYAAMQTDYLEWASGFSRLAMRNEKRPELAAVFAKSLRSLRPDIALSVARSIFQSDYRHILPHVKKDILLIQSHNDIAVPKEAATYLHHHINGSKLNYIDADGHFPHISAPGEIISCIQEFVELQLA
jgi:sigma-B regulation protein RsbQ